MEEKGYRSIEKLSELGPLCLMCKLYNGISEKDLKKEFKKRLSFSEYWKDILDLNIVDKSGDKYSLTKDGKLIYGQAVEYRIIETLTTPNSILLMSKLDKKNGLSEKGLDYEIKLAPHLIEFWSELKELPESVKPIEIPPIVEKIHNRYFLTNYSKYLYPLIKKNWLDRYTLKSTDEV